MLYWPRRKDMNVMNPRDYLTQIQVKEQQFYFSIVKAEFEDTEGVIRIRKSKKNRRHNCQKKKDKKTNNDLQNTMY